MNKQNSESGENNSILLRPAWTKIFKTVKDKADFHLFADAFEDTMCKVTYLHSQPTDFSAVSAFVFGKCRVALMRYLSIPRLELKAIVMAVRLKEQIVKEQESNIQLQFLKKSTRVL